MNYRLVKTGFLGSIIGAIVSGVKGRKQAKQAKAAGNRADDLVPQSEDYNQRLLLNEINRKRLSVLSGSSSSLIKDQLQNSVASAADVAVNMGSGSGTDLLSVIRSQQAVAGQYNQQLAQQENMNFQNLAMSESLTDKIAQRSLDLQNYEMLRERANSERLYQSSEENKAGAIGLTVDMLNKATDFATAGLTSGGSGIMSLLTPNK